MAHYPFKLRLVRRGSVLYLEELAATSKGSYFVNDRVILPEKDLVAAAKALAPATMAVMGDRNARFPQTDTENIPAIGG